MKKLFFLLLTLLGASNLFAQKTTSLSLKFDNFVGNDPVELNTKSYKNQAGEDFNISLLQYYVSNIQLVKKDGSVYTVPQDDSYFLVRQNRPETQTITLKDIPQDKYVGINFVIGIDSARSAAEIGYRKGCLDVAGDAQDMYWAWNSGYIFVKMEGSSPQSTLKENIFMYHIGLFGGIGDKKTLNNIRNVSLAFNNETIKLKAGKVAPIIRIKMDASKILNGETTVSIAKNPSVMGGPYSAKIAENYKSMFSYNGIGMPAPTEKISLGLK